MHYSMALTGLESERIFVIRYIKIFGRTAKNSPRTGITSAERKCNSAILHELSVGYNSTQEKERKQTRKSKIAERIISMKCPRSPCAKGRKSPAEGVYLHDIESAVYTAHSARKAAPRATIPARTDEDAMPRAALDDDAVLVGDDEAEPDSALTAPVPAVADVVDDVLDASRTVSRS